MKRINKWSGDHLFDPTEVPGVLFISNSKYQIANKKDPKIEDIMQRVLEFRLP